MYGFVYFFLYEALVQTFVISQSFSISCLGDVGRGWFWGLRGVIKFLVRRLLSDEYKSPEKVQAAHKLLVSINSENGEQFEYTKIKMY